MTVLYKIDPNLKLIYYEGFGLCTGDDFLNSEREAFKDPLRVPEMRIIMDVRYAELDINLKDVRALIELNRQLIKDGHKLERTALISKNTFMNTLGDMLRLMADNIPLTMEFFYLPRDSAKWLGLADTEETIEQISNSLLEEYKKKALTNTNL